jgi:hypothetical protein
MRQSVFSLGSLLSRNARREDLWAGTGRTRHVVGNDEDVDDETEAGESSAMCVVV